MGVGALITRLTILIVAVSCFASRSLAIDAVAGPPQNSRWHCSDKLNVATFLAGDKPEAAILVLDKAKVIGQTIMTDAYSEITNDMIGDQKCWTALTANGRSILAQKSPTLGTAVVSLVEVKQSIKQGDDKRRFLVRVIGTDKQVYVDDPVLADELKSGHALMGGMVDEPVTAEGGEKMTVLRGGFLIAPPINHDWWWWYKDQE